MGPIAPIQGLRDPRFQDIGPVTTTDETPATLATIPIEDNTTVIVFAFVSAFRTNGIDQAGYTRSAVIFRRGGVATIQGPVQSAFTRESDDTWKCTIEVSGDDALVRITGAAGKTINWNARCQFIEVE